MKKLTIILVMLSFIGLTVNAQVKKPATSQPSKVTTTKPAPAKPAPAKPAPAKPTPAPAPEPAKPAPAKPQVVQSAPEQPKKATENISNNYASNNFNPRFIISGQTQISYTNNAVQMPGTSSSEKIKISSLALSPSFGYNITTNVTIGGTLAIATFKSKMGDTDWARVLSLTSIATYGRYHLYPLAQNGINPFGQVMLGYSSAKLGDTDPDKYSGLMYGATVGASYYFTRNAGIDAGLNYSATSLKLKSGSISKSPTSSPNENLKYGTFDFLLGMTIRF